MDFSPLATALGVASAAMYPDVVSFKRPTYSVDSVGGSTSILANSATSIPARWRYLRASERVSGDRNLSGADYVISVPNYYQSSLIDVDATCQAVLSSRSNGEPSRTFNINGIIRNAGLEIKVYCSIEEA